MFIFPDVFIELLGFSHDIGETYFISDFLFFFNGEIFININTVKSCCSTCLLCCTLYALEKMQMPSNALGPDYTRNALLKFWSWLPSKCD